MLELRDYQDSLVVDLRTALTDHRSAILQLATGAGKTAIAGAVAMGLAQRGRELLALVHRRELVTQMCDTLDLVGLSGHYGVIAAGRAPSPWAKMQVGAIQTLFRRDHLRMNPAIIVVDECHHVRAKTWQAVLERFPRARRLGMTATPERMDGKPLGKYFEVLVEGPSIPWLTTHGWMAPFSVKFVTRDLLTRGIRKLGGDYNRKDLGDRLTRKAVAAPVKAYLQHAADRKAIFFGLNTADSKGVAELFRTHGVRAVHVDGKTPRPERDRAVREFRDGHVQVFCNVDIAGEGTDFPSCDCVIMGLPTLSLTRYLQMAGRCARPDHGRDGLIIDTVGNVGRHGFPDDNRAWDIHRDLTEARTKTTSEKRTTMAVCVHCATVYQSSSGVCPACGKAKPLETPKHLDIELITRDGDESMPKPKNRPSMADVRREFRAVIRNRTGAAGVREIREKYGLNGRWEENAINSLGVS